MPVIRLDGDDWARLLARHNRADVPDATVDDDTLLMLIFTSGTSGSPKAVNVTQAKVAVPGVFLSERFGLTPDDVAYLSMPMFHSNAIMAGWGPALASGATIALARRFSASGFLADVRRHGATYANYVGKPLTYIMATPERPDDADNPLRLVFGNEANERDIAEFGRRFGCVVVDSYSSTENAVIVQRTDDMPPGSLGRPLDGSRSSTPRPWPRRPTRSSGPTAGCSTATRRPASWSTPRAPGPSPATTRTPTPRPSGCAAGMYWSGDLAYRDADGFVYFAGRTADWLRVDGENIAAAPVERILLRHPAISEAAVYAVPDESVGDQLMVALTILAPLTRVGPRGVPGRPARPLPQGLAALRADRRRVATHRHQQGAQATARRRRSGLRRRHPVDPRRPRHGVRLSREGQPRAMSSPASSGRHGYQQSTLRRR